MRGWPLWQATIIFVGQKTRQMGVHPCPPLGPGLKIVILTTAGRKNLASIKLADPSPRLGGQGGGEYQT